MVMAESLELKDIANKLSRLEGAFADAAKLYGLDKKRSELKEKEAVSGSGDFWNDAQKAQAHLKELNDLKKGVEMLDAAAAELAPRARQAKAKARLQARPPLL